MGGHSNTGAQTYQARGQSPVAHAASFYSLTATAVLALHSGATVSTFNFFVHGRRKLAWKSDCADAALKCFGNHSLLSLTF